MQSKIEFITPNKISILDITIMGGSSKLGCDKTIGEFGSGLKYAIAILKRHDIKMTVKTSDFIYKFFVKRLFCSNTEKFKDIIEIEVSSLASHDSQFKDTCIELGFGHDWELWMAFRELYANMVDEGGFYEINGVLTIPKENSTIITLYYDESSEFSEIIKNRHLYINENPPLFTLENGTAIRLNNEDERYLKIYKKGILIYSDKNKKSLLSYDSPFGDIDERRILRDLNVHMNRIVDEIISTTTSECLDFFITENQVFDEDDYINDFVSWGNCPEHIYKRAKELYDKNGEYFSIKPIIDIIKRKKGSDLPGRIIKSVQDHFWTYTQDVQVESIPEECITLKEKILQKYNLEDDFEVKQAYLKFGNSVADKSKNTILVSEKFDEDNEEHMSEFIVSRYDMKRGNLIKNLALSLIRLLKFKK